MFGTCRCDGQYRGRMSIVNCTRRHGRMVVVRLVIKLKKEKNTRQKGIQSPENLNHFNFEFASAKNGFSSFLPLFFCIHTSIALTLDTLRFLFNRACDDAEF